MTRRGAVCALAVLALAAGGCNGDDEPAQESERAPKPRRERIDHVPKLPDGWEAHVNRRGGFAFGLPRGWRAEDEGPTSLVRSFDRLAAISIAADRSDEALALAPREFAKRTALALRGYERLRHRPPRRFRHRYDGASVGAEGRAKRTGLRQRVRILVLRRPRLAVYTAVIAVNAERDSERSEELALEVVETLRGRPAVERRRHDRRGGRERSDRGRQPSRSGRSG